MPFLLQVKLLRVLQEKTIHRVGGTQEIPVDARLIAATNKRLDEEVAAGRFRQDLYYRLNVVTIALPPLRDRKEDIALLARHFTDKYTSAFHRPQRGLSHDALECLRNYAWPGNVRQLEHAVERAVALAEEEMITAEAFSEVITPSREDVQSKILKLPLREAKQQFERQYLLENLRCHGGSVTRAAIAAGLPRQNFHRKMKQLGLKPVNLTAKPSLLNRSEPA